MRVEQGRDGELRVWFEGRAVALEEIDRPPTEGACGAAAARGAASAQVGGGPSLAAAAAVAKTENGKCAGLWK